MELLKTKNIDGILVMEILVPAILDPLTVESVHEELVLKAEESGSEKIILDFTQVEFISSGMLGALIAFRSLGTVRGFQLKLGSLTQELERIFSVTELCSLFAIYPSLQRAVEQYRTESFLARHGASVSHARI